MSFGNYIHLVQREMDKITGGGIDLDDLPDWDYMAAYEDELPPAEAAAEALAEAGFES